MERAGRAREHVADDDLPIRLPLSFESSLRLAAYREELLKSPDGHRQLNGLLAGGCCPEAIELVDFGLQCLDCGTYFIIRTAARLVLFRKWMGWTVVWHGHLSEGWTGTAAWRQTWT
jgi:hypothetical protein